MNPMRLLVGRHLVVAPGLAEVFPAKDQPCPTGAVGCTAGRALVLSHRKGVSEVAKPDGFTDGTRGRPDRLGAPSGNDGESSFDSWAEGESLSRNGSG